MSNVCCHLVQVAEALAGSSLDSDAQEGVSSRLHSEIFLPIKRPHRDCARGFQGVSTQAVWRVRERRVCMSVCVCLQANTITKVIHLWRSGSLFFLGPTLRHLAKPQRVTEHKRKGRKKEEEEVLLV